MDCVFCLIIYATVLDTHKLIVNPTAQVLYGVSSGKYVCRAQGAVSIGFVLLNEQVYHAHAYLFDFVFASHRLLILQLVSCQGFR